MDSIIKEKLPWGYILIHVIIILVLIMLIVKIRMQESNFDCNKCEITFNNKIGFEEDNQFETEVKAKLVDLYNSYLNNKCLIRYDNSGGFVGGTNLTFE